MPDPDRVRRYFDGEATEYTGRSNTGLWKWFRDRETRAVLDLLNPTVGETILDAGSGAGYYTERLVESGARVTAVDLSSAMLSVLRQRLDVDTIEGDLTKVGLEPKFDKILCAGALEFVSDPAAAVANLGRALSPDGPGVLVLLLPRDSWMGRGYRRFHRGHGFRVNLFRHKDLEALTRAAGGFRIDSIRGVTFNFALRLCRVSSPPVS